jgi:hypothetical protein
MTTDRELLEAAARAGGVKLDLTIRPDGLPLYCSERGFAIDEVPGWWNPLVDDGPALRLAVKLRLLPVVEDWSDGPWVFVPSQPGNAEPLGADQCAATRRAIVRAAAATAPHIGSEG